MEYIRVTKDNLEKEHICCAISNNKDIQVSSKKAWLADRFDDGLVFLKSTERGKCFIEYIPAENAWNPIDADGYVFIDCLWVSGSFKGHGYSNDLLGACVADSRERGKKGLCTLCAEKKKPFLAGICLFLLMWSLPDSRTAPGILMWRRRVMSFITQASALSMRSMSQSWSRLPKSMIFRSGRSISKVKNKRRTLRRRSRTMHCSVMESI